MSEFKEFHVIKAKLKIGAAQTWATTAVNLANDTITLPNHGLFTGQPCGLSTTGAVPTGLTALTVAYYVIVVDLNTIGLATSLALAIAGTKVGLSAVGSGVGSLYPNGLGNVELGQFVPDNAIITRAFYDVVTTFTSVTSDTGSIALTTSTGNNQLYSAETITNAAAWDAAGAKVMVPIETTGTMIKMSANGSLRAVLAADTITAGELNLYVEYLLSE